MDKYDVKYICDDVYSIFFADIYRSRSGVFAIDVEVSKDGVVRYKQLPAAFTFAYGLEPRFVWWQEHGIWVILAPLIIIFGLGTALEVVKICTRRSSHPKAIYSSILPMGLLLAWIC